MREKRINIFILIALLILFVTSCQVTSNKSSTTSTTIDYTIMIPISGSNFTQTDGKESFSHTISNFSLGKYEVTYELWYKVYQWSLSNGYNFTNAGKEGHDGIVGAVPTSAKYEPVTTISWYDAIVWCNAYSEMSGLTPCYTFSSTTIKDSRETNEIALDSVVCDWTPGKGYRLPTEGEWQFASSNKGITPWNYVSGATDDYNNTIETKKVAWYDSNSSSSSKPVGTTMNSNELAIYDMSGNVWEWCWDWYGEYPDASTSTDYKGPDSGSERIVRGGAYLNFANVLLVGYRHRIFPFEALLAFGFRVARTN